MNNWFTKTISFNRKFNPNINLHLNAIYFTVFVVIASMIIYHIPLYSFAINNINYLSLSGVRTFITLLVISFTVNTLILLFLFIISHHIIKPFSILIALTNSIALYFITTYQVIIDKDMIGNIINTDLSEASSYFHPKLIIYFIIFGIIPSFFLMKIRIKTSSRIRLLSYTIATLAFCLIWVYINSSTWLWFDKNARKLGGLAMPLSYIANTILYKNEQLKSSKKQELLPTGTFANNKKIVVILVIGETARAQNFSLYGYNRNTNPLLSKNNVIALNNSVSCSTYTSLSLRCMLSHTSTNSLFDKQYEPLPSYLQRNGVDVIWRTNNWGEPPIIVQDYQKRSELKNNCTGIDCNYDSVLLTGLIERIKTSKQKKIFVILHQKGSHGPSYYTQYPKKFEIFKPVCKSVELNACSKQELINAYDNTILYTDYFINKSINLLKKLQNTETLLIYASDHGESLGEYGLYLHGTPFSIAPDVQKNIPFIIWMSDNFMQSREIIKTEFKQKNKHSHKHIFHSVMGAFYMNSVIYNEELDIFNQ